MIPHPPFASQLTLEEELAAYQALKPNLARVWEELVRQTGTAHTTVVVPSMTLDQAEMAKIAGVSFYEERLLFLLMRLRNPRARMVYVTSQPVHPAILDYLLQMLPGVPASHARARLTMLSAHDASDRPLTLKVLERPRLIERIRRAIPNPEQAFLSVFNATPLERRLSVLLGIPLNGADPALCHLGTKSGSRRVFRAAGVPCPEGMEDLRDEQDVRAALAELGRRRPGLRRAVIKLNEGFSGEGNAIFRYPADAGARPLELAMQRLRFTAAGERRATYFAKFASGGGVVEEFLEARECHSPSVQLRTSPTGEVMPLSTHDQLLGGPAGQIFLGCEFPAADAYRLDAMEAGRRIGRVLADAGVVSRFGVDFMATRDDPSEGFRLHAIEINLRLGGTTHPFLALRFLTDGALDPATGMFHAVSGRPKFYRATDNLQSDRYRGVLPEDLLEIVTHNQLNFDYRAETGVLFHLIGALSQFGKLGLTAIGNSRTEAEELYRHTLEVLDLETAYG